MMTEIIEEKLSIDIQQVEKSRLPEVDFENLPFGRVFSDHMLVADYKDKKWHDLRIVPYHNISFSPAMSTLHYAQSIFEGLKAYKRNDGSTYLFRPEDNFQRMNVSAERMCMPEIPREAFMDGLMELIKLDQRWVPNQEGSTLYVRPFMFAADDFIGVRPADNYKFMIFTCPVASYYAEPVRVRMETEFTRATKGGIGYAKTAGNYAASLYAARKAQQEGYHQVIWTDGVEHKYIEESGTMNLFFKIDGTLITATLGDSVLDGITRKSIIQLAKDFGQPVEERRISVAEIAQALKDGRVEEAFGAGTAAVISFIKTIGHEGVDYDLPPIVEGTFAYKAKETLHNIRMGKVEDTHQWMVKVC